MTTRSRRFGKFLNRSASLRLCAFAAATAALAGFAADVQAAPITWSSTVNNVWATGTNWVGNTAPADDLLTDTAVFNNTTYSGNIDIGTARSVNGIQMNATSSALTIGTGGTQTLSIGSGGINMSTAAANLTLNANAFLAGSQTWNINTGRTLTVNNGFYGYGTLTKSGNGGLTLNSGTAGNYHFSGLINITAGTVTANQGYAARYSDINIASGATYNGINPGSLAGAGTLTTTGTPLFYNYNDATFSGNITNTFGAVQIRGFATQGFDTTRITGTGGRLEIYQGAGIRLSGALTGTSSQVVNLTPTLFGGSIHLDNSAANGTRFDANQSLTVSGGGLFRITGNTAANTTTTVTSLLFNDNAGVNNGRGGWLRVILENDNSGNFSNVLNFTGTLNPVASANNNGSAIDFGNVNGTLGTAGANPRITFGTAPTVTNGIIGDASRRGWATVNGVDFATYGANGVAALSSYTSYGSATNTQNAILTGSDTNGGRTVNTLKIAGNGSLTGTGSLVTGAILLASNSTPYAYTISAAGVNNGNQPLYFHVPDAGASLTVTTAVGTGSGAITMSGAGTLILSGGTAGTTGDITINGGVLEVPLTGTSASSRIFTNGGVIQFFGNGTTQAKTVNVGTGAGNINLGYGGGFAARNGNVTLTSANLNWNTLLTTGELIGGGKLMFGSTTADSMVDVVSNISLGGGLNFRQIIVTDNPNSTTDIARLSGVISETAGALNDLVKLGDGVLELANTSNSWAGGTQVLNGELRLRGNAPKGANGTLGNSSLAYVLVGNRSGSNNAALYTSDNGAAGAFNVGRDITAQAGSSGTVTLGTLDTNGTSTWSGTINLGRSVRASAASGGTVDFTGIVQGVGSLQKIGGGIVRLSRSGGNTYSGGTTVTAGTLLIANSTGSATGTGTVTVNGGTLGGTGRIAGDVTVNSGGTYAPGNSIGTIDHAGANLTLAGTSNFEISRAAGPVFTNDLATNIGTLTYGGVLNVTLDGGSQPTSSFAINDSWDLFNFNSFSGTFSSLNLPTLNAGLAWQFNYGTGVLSIVNAVTRNASLTSSAQYSRRDDFTDATDDLENNSGSNPQRVLMGVEVDGLNTDIATAVQGSVRINPGPDASGRTYIAMWLTGGDTNINALIGELDDDTAYLVRSFGAGETSGITLAEWNYVQAYLGNTSFGQFNVLFAFDNPTGSFFNWDFTGAGVGVEAVAAIPEPTSLALLGLGAAGLLARRRRR